MVHIKIENMEALKIYNWKQDLWQFEVHFELIPPTLPIVP